jgi:hypothetical protein
MIVNKSGSLGSVKRHDYLPFGEELSAGLGGRTAEIQIATLVRQAKLGVSDWVEVPVE